MSSIGKKITQLRTEMGYTQKQLAKLANITEASLSRYENGLREPKINTLVKLAKVLGCTVDYMVGNTDVIDGIIVDRQKLPELLKTVDLQFLSIAKDLEQSDIPAEDLRAIVEIIAKNRTV